MNIGAQLRTLTIEPIRDPVPKRREAEPQPTRPERPTPVTQSARSSE
jgi:hypothetical protein